MSWDELVAHYVGHRVCVAVYHQMKYWGRLERAYADSLLLTDVVSVRETDDQGWSGYLQYGDAEETSGVSWPEVVLRFDQVLSITCVDHEFERTDSLPHSTGSAAGPAPKTIIPPGTAEPDGAHDEERGRIENALETDAVMLEVGTDICGRIIQKDGFLDRIKDLRLRLARERGAVLPAVRVRDHLSLPPNVYRIFVNGRSVAEGQLHPDHHLIVDPPEEVFELDGIITSEPVGGLPAMWVPHETRTLFEGIEGLFIVDCEHVLMAHLNEVFVRFAGELLSGDDVEQMLTIASERGNWSLGRELSPGFVPLPVVHRVLSQLLEERVPLKPLRMIVETLAYESQFGSEADRLLEATRQTLRREITDPLCDPARLLATWQLHPETTELLAEPLADSSLWPRLVSTPYEPPVLLPTTALARLIEILPEEATCLVVPIGLRRVLWEAASGLRPRLSVICWEEIPTDYEVVCERMIALEDLLQTPSRTTSTPMKAPHFTIHGDDTEPERSTKRHANHADNEG